MKDFITPANHVNFLAKKLFKERGRIIDGSIAYLEKGGGGPVEMHAHLHNHLFIVVSGQAKIKLEGSEIIINENESYLIEGQTLHSVWNNLDTTTVIIGISVTAE